MYIDLLVQIRNAQAARKDSLKIPYTKMDFSVAELLERFGYVKSVEKKGRMPKRIIEIELAYEDGAGAIHGVKFVSKPSLKEYRGYKKLFLVQQGYGLGVISTSRGIMTSKEARKQKIGGALLFEIW